MNNSAQNSTQAKVLFIDNFDSFSFNIVDDVKQLGAEVTVIRNDAKMELLEAFVEAESITHIIISPGPGAPKDAGNCIEIVNRYQGKIPLFGICLGFQVIVESLGGEVAEIEYPYHGKSSNIIYQNSQLLIGLPNPFRAGRYHSLGAQSVTSDLKVTASVGEIPMVIENSEKHIYGVQFHPESILTPDGNQILSNFFAQSL